ncbi:hypothetical protein V8V91_00760 [Algoriphagus halophilus]|uniref:hypothetical protein n=1 Tax=Algoriphagus halophilus TaxID=226505 RepID=UPI00358E88A0
MVVALFLGNVGGSEARQLFKKDSTKSEIKSKKLYFIPLPAISYNPAFGFIYGVAATSSILLGDPKDTKLSSGFLNATYSSKKQLVIGLKTTIYTQKISEFFRGLEIFGLFSTNLWPWNRKTN